MFPQEITKIVADLPSGRDSNQNYNIGICANSKIYMTRKKIHNSKKVFEIPLTTSSMMLPSYQFILIIVP